MAHQQSVRLYFASHVGTRWKIQDRRLIKNRHYKNKTQPRKSKQRTIRSRTKPTGLVASYDTRPGNEMVQRSRAHTGPQHSSIFVTEPVLKPSPHE